MYIFMDVHFFLQTWHLMQEAKYGKDEDQVGVLRLVQNNCFNGYYPLHEVSRVMPSVTIVHVLTNVLV